MLKLRLNSTGFARLVAASLASLLLFSFATAAEKSTAPDETVLGLSPYEVTAQKLVFKSWLKVSSPHFVVYTDTKKKEAMLLVKQMEMLHQAAQFFLHRKAVSSAPTIVVLPTSSSDWRKIGNKSNVEWKVATSMVGTTRSMILVEYDWQMDNFSSVWAMLGCREVLAMNLDGPLWYIAGIRSFFRTVEFNQNTLTVGKQGWDAAIIEKLGWMDWGQFFQVTPGSPVYRENNVTHDRYLAQCGMFVHYALTNADPSATPALLTWAARLNAGGVPTVDNFKEVFGTDWSSWKKKIEDMVSGGRYTTGKIAFPPEALAFPITESEPTTPELRELFVLAQIMNQRNADSVASLNLLLTRGLKTTFWRELLADACGSRARFDDELEQLRTIVKSGSSNPLVYARAAELLFKKLAPERTFDAHSGIVADEIRTLCVRALEIEPLNPSANDILAWIEAYSEKVEKDNLELIAQICKNINGNGPTDEALCALTVARYRSGNLKQARSLAERLVGSPMTRAPARKTAQAMLNLLNASADTPVSATPEKS